MAEFLFHSPEELRLYPSITYTGDDSFIESISSLNIKSCIYIVWGVEGNMPEGFLENGAVVYVGQSINIVSRVNGDHHIVRPLRWLKNKFHISLISTDTSQLLEVEEAAIKFYKPVFNMRHNTPDNAAYKLYRLLPYISKCKGDVEAAKKLYEADHPPREIVNIEHLFDEYLKHVALARACGY